MRAQVGALTDYPLAGTDLRAHCRRRQVRVSPDVDSKGAAHDACDIEDVSFRCRMHRPRAPRVLMRVVGHALDRLVRGVSEFHDTTMM